MYLGVIVKSLHLHLNIQIYTAKLYVWQSLQKEITAILWNNSVCLPMNRYVEMI